MMKIRADQIASQSLGGSASKINKSSGFSNLIHQNINKTDTISTSSTVKQLRSNLIAELSDRASDIKGQDPKKVISTFVECVIKERMGSMPKMDENAIKNQVSDFISNDEVLAKNIIQKFEALSKA